MKKLLLLVVVIMSVASSFAQEDKRQIHQDSIPSGKSFYAPQQADMQTTIAPAMDFAPDPLMMKMMTINPLAVTIPPMELPYLAKWDKGGILGFSGERGMYLGSYQGLDISYANFGVMVGVQRGYMPYAGQWSIMPMAIPYYKLGQTKIGVDVGGILYNQFSKPEPGNPLGVKDYHGSGIIAPPIDTKAKFNTVEVPQWIEKQYDQQAK